MLIWGWFQEAKTVELHLFKLYHNDVELKLIREGLTAKETTLAQEQENRQNIEDEIKEKKKEVARLGRDAAAVEVEIRKCVSNTPKYRLLFVVYSYTNIFKN